MALRLGIDMDGVLADMDRALAQELAQLSPGGAEPPHGGDASEPPNRDPAAAGVAHLALTPAEQRRLWQHVKAIENFWEGLGEIEPGAVGRLAAAADAHRWEVVFLTSRPATAGHTTQRQTQRWLHARGFPHPSVCVVRRSRGRIAAALDLNVLVDDRLENCVDIAMDSSAQAILIWRDSAGPRPAANSCAGATLVESMDACLNLLAERDETFRSKPRRLSRMKQLLGWQAPALD
jgi:hypothetical protein